MMHAIGKYYYTQCYSFRSGYLGRFVGHNGALCALVIKGNLMATGSRDRLIKVSINMFVHYHFSHIFVGDFSCKAL